MKHHFVLEVKVYNLKLTYKFLKHRSIGVIADVACSSSDTNWIGIHSTIETFIDLEKELSMRCLIENDYFADVYQLLIDCGIYPYAKPYND